jgi:hypothetical protein
MEIRNNVGKWCHASIPRLHPLLRSLVTIYVVGGKKIIGAYAIYTLRTVVSKKTLSDRNRTARFRQDYGIR